MTVLHRLMLATLLAVAVLALAPAPAPAKAGEDFPFFCSMSESGRSFKVTSDPRSPTGYTLTLYRRAWFDARMPVEIEPTADGKYWFIQARRITSALFVDRQVLAYIALADNRNSHGDVKVSLHDAEGRGWDLQPMSCDR